MRALFIIILTSVLSLLHAERTDKLVDERSIYIGDNEADENNHIASSAFLRGSIHSFVEADERDGARGAKVSEGHSNKVGKEGRKGKEGKKDHHNLEKFDPLVKSNSGVKRGATKEATVYVIPKKIGDKAIYTPLGSNSHQNDGKEVEGASKTADVVTVKPSPLIDPIDNVERNLPIIPHLWRHDEDISVEQVPVKEANDVKINYNEEEGSGHPPSPQQVGADDVADEVALSVRDDVSSSTGDVDSLSDSLAETVETGIVSSRNETHTSSKEDGSIKGEETTDNVSKSALTASDSEAVSAGGLIVDSLSIVNSMIDSMFDAEPHGSSIHVAPDTISMPPLPPIAAAEQTHFESEADSKDAIISHMLKNTQILSEDLSDTKAKVLSLEEIIERSESQLGEKDAQIVSLESMLTESQREIAEKERGIADYKRTIEGSNQQVSSLESMLAHSKTQIEDLSSHLLNTTDVLDVLASDMSLKHDALYSDAENTRTAHRKILLENQILDVWAKYQRDYSAQLDDWEGELDKRAAKVIAKKQLILEFLYSKIQSLSSKASEIRVGDGPLNDEEIEIPFPEDVHDIPVPVVSVDEVTTPATSSEVTEPTAATWTDSPVSIEDEESTTSKAMTEAPTEIETSETEVTTPEGESEGKSTVAEGEPTVAEGSTEETTVSGTSVSEATTVEGDATTASDEPAATEGSIEGKSEVESSSAEVAQFIELYEEMSLSRMKLQHLQRSRSAEALIKHHLMDILKPEMMDLSTKAIAAANSAKSSEEKLIADIDAANNENADIIAGDVEDVVTASNENVSKSMEDIQSEAFVLRTQTLVEAKERYDEAVNASYTKEQQLLDEAKSIALTFLSSNGTAGTTSQSFKSTRVSLKTNQWKSLAEAKMRSVIKEAGDNLELAEKLLGSVKAQVNESIAAAEENVKLFEEALNVTRLSADEDIANTAQEIITDGEAIKVMKDTVDSTRDEMRSKMESLESLVKDTDSKVNTAELELKVLKVKESLKLESLDQFNPEVVEAEREIKSLKRSIDSANDAMKNLETEEDGKLKVANDMYVCSDGRRVYDTANCVEGPRGQSSAVAAESEEFKKKAAEIDDQIVELEASLVAAEKKKTLAEGKIKGLQLEKVQEELLDAENKLVAALDAKVVAEENLEHYRFTTEEFISTTLEKIDAAESSLAESRKEAEVEKVELSEEVEEAANEVYQKIAELEEAVRVGEATIAEAEADYNALVAAATAKPAEEEEKVDLGYITESYEKLIEELAVERESEIATAREIYKNEIIMANGVYGQTLHDALSERQKIIVTDLQDQLYNIEHPKVDEVKQFPLRDSKAKLSQVINDTIALDEEIISILNGTAAAEPGQSSIESKISQVEMKDELIETIIPEVASLEVKRQEEEKLLTVQRIHEAIEKIQATSTRAAEEADKDDLTVSGALAEMMRILNPFADANSTISAANSTIDATALSDSPTDVVESSL